MDFHGETDEEHNSTKRKLEVLKLYKTHVFKYSKRDGTLAAKRTDQIQDSIKDKRSKELLILSDENSLDINKRFVGKTVDVLVEEQKDGKWVGHSKEFLRVTFKSDKDLKNYIVRVKIDNENLEGTLVL